MTMTTEEPVPRIDELPDWVTPREAAAVARRTVNAMAILRSEGRGPRWFKHTGKVLYRKSDLLAWLDGETESPLAGGG